jgi:hypothetical protein
MPVLDRRSAGRREQVHGGWPGHRRGAPSIAATMKLIYIFGAILICSLLGALVANRAMKTALLVATGALSLYGIFRLVG